MRSIGLGVLVVACGAAYGAVKLGAPFTDGMTLRTGGDVAVWGWADPGSHVEVKFAGVVADANAINKGYWRARFRQPLAPSDEGHDLVVFENGKPACTLKGVRVRDLPPGNVYGIGGAADPGSESAPPGQKAAEEFPIRVNQVGYLPGATKMCYMKNPPLPTFLVQRGATDICWHTVCTGTWAKASGDWFVGDFSPVHEPGDYRILCGELKGTERFRMPDWRPAIQSYHFPIRAGVYDTVERMAFNYINWQRCGSRQGWAGECHQDPVPLLDAEGRTVRTLDARGGYHQSCDLRNWHDGISMSLYGLLRYAELKTPGWDDGSLAAELRWGCDYFLKVIAPEGYVYDAQFAPIGWGPRHYYLAPATLGAQCNVAALFARAARFFQPADAAYAAKLLAASRRVWHEIETNPFFEVPRPAPEKNLPAGAQPAERCYPQQYRTSVNGYAERAYAALELFRTTREAAFAACAKQYGGEMLKALIREGEEAGCYRDEKGKSRLAFTDWSYCWRISGYRTPLELWREFGDDCWKEATLCHAERLLRMWRKDGFAMLRAPSTAAANALLLLEAGERTGRPEYRACAQGMFDWIFGVNGWNASFMEGAGQRQWQRPVFGQFFPSTPQIPGAVLHVPNGEYDMPPTAFTLWACAGLAHFTR